MRRRPVWPWVAALLFVIGAGVGGWFLYSEVSNKLNSTKPVPVQLYLAMPEANARTKIKADGFGPSSTTTRAARRRAGSSSARTRPRATGSRRGAP